VASILHDGVSFSEWPRTTPDNDTKPAGRANTVPARPARGSLAELL